MNPLDPAMLGAWYDAYAAPLLLYARQWLDRAAAEDVVQSAFAGLVARRTPPEAAKAWLFTVVRNAAIRHATVARPGRPVSAQRRRVAEY